MRERVKREEGSLTVSPWVLKAPQAWLLLFCLRSGREPRKPVEEYLGWGRGRGRGALTGTRGRVWETWRRLL